MAAVLGIDAAWTATQPSGVTLIKNSGSVWQLIAVAASYLNFIDGSDRSVSQQSKPLPSIMDLRNTLDASTAMINDTVDLIAIDMPLAKTAIVARRHADNAVSRAYGARKCGTHTPSAIRPGPISDVIRETCEASGYPLLTKDISTPGLIEVYPHPALVELTGAIERLPYKMSKTRSYWRSETPMNRRVRLLDQWTAIVAALENEIDGVNTMLPVPLHTATTWQLKAFEDVLDAVICAWVGICALEDRAIPYGDDDAAIWIPVANENVG
jgi:predicted RNase H-like nuclease